MPLRIIPRTLVPLIDDQDPAPHIAAVPLHSTKAAHEALTTKQLRRLQPGGKRHGKGFAYGLGIYAGMVRCARLNVRDIKRMAQGDHAERRALDIVGTVREQWASIAPERSLVRGGFLRGAK